MAEVVQIKRFIDFQKGKAPKETFDFPAKGLEPYLSPEYLRGTGNPLYVKPSNKLVSIDAGELIILWDGSNAGEVFVSKSGVLGSTMTKIIFDESEFDKSYFTYALKYNEYFLKAKTAGSGIPHVDKGIVKKIEVFKPEKPEQRVIASKLSKVDEAIAATKNSIAKAERLKKSLMQNLLTGKLKPDGTWRKDDEFQEIKMGFFPKEWEIKTVSQISTKVTDGEHTTPVRVEKGNYLLSARNIKNGYLDLKDVDYVDDAELKKIQKRCKPEKGDLLISCSGTLGNVCIVPEGLNCGLVRSVALVKIRQDIIEPEFVEILFQTPFMFKQMMISVSSSVQGNLFQGAIKKLKLPYPSEKERSFMIQKFQGVNHTIKSKQIKIAKLERLKKALMQNLLTGKVRVKVPKSASQTATK